MVGNSNSNANAPGDGIPGVDGDELDVVIMGGRFLRPDPDSLVGEPLPPLDDGESNDGLSIKPISTCDGKGG